jgi:hypothetical protein
MSNEIVAAFTSTEAGPEGSWLAFVDFKKVVAASYPGTRGGRDIVGIATQTLALSSDPAISSLLRPVAS